MEYWERRDNPWNLQYVPTEHRTAAMCQSAVQRDPLTFQYVAERLRTPELCQMAVRADSFNFQFVPFEQRTQEICQLGIKNYGYALQEMPEAPRTLRTSGAPKRLGLTICADRAADHGHMPPRRSTGGLVITASPRTTADAGTLRAGGPPGGLGDRICPGRPANRRIMSISYSGVRAKMLTQPAYSSLDAYLQALQTTEPPPPPNSRPTVYPMELTPGLGSEQCPVAAGPRFGETVERPAVDGDND